MKPTNEMIAAAWQAWHKRHGGKLGPGPAFVEAIEAAFIAAPTDMLVRYAMQRRDDENLEKELARAEPCPKCKIGKLLSQNGGGVACNATGCSYWFCY